ncbi:MAG: DNA polymerase III subunit chi [Pseudomonadota bacterium]
MKIDFWQISRDPVEKVVSLIAQKVMGEGERLLVVSQDASQREAISKELWKASPDSFLANGHADNAGADRQPILLSASTEPANTASHVILADGQFRSPDGFARAFLLFDDSTLEAARGTWRSLDGHEALERAFFRQEGGKWVKVA